jgi:hypothetical protein
MSDDVRCALCHHPIEAQQTVVFQVDGQVAHVTCLAADPKPLARLVPEPAPDPICPACSKPIRPVQSLVKSGTDRLHVDCFLEQRRQIGGGAAGAGPRGR